MSNRSIHELNVALCAALGITDTSRVQEVMLVLSATKPPQVLVRQMVPPTADKQLASVLQAFELRPIGGSDAG